MQSTWSGGKFTNPAGRSANVRAYAFNRELGAAFVVPNLVVPRVSVTVGVIVGVGATVWVGVRVGISVGVGLGVYVGVAVGVLVGVSVGVGVLVGVGLGVYVGVEVGAWAVCVANVSALTRVAVASSSA